MGHSDWGQVRHLLKAGTCQIKHELIQLIQRIIQMKRCFFPFIILLAPIFMFHWLLPFVSGITFFPDYRLSVESQLECLFALKSGTFPLYIPINIGDFPASCALQLGQLFLPFPYLLAIIPGYWSGAAQDLNLLLQLLTIPIAHLALFVFLHRLKINERLSFVLSTLTVYNPRSVSSLSLFGPWSASLFLCAMLGLYCLRPTKRKGPLLIIAATYWVVCSPNGVDVYYGMLGAALLILILPFFLSVMRIEEKVDIRKAINFWVRAGTFVFLGILLSSANWLFLYFNTIRQSGISDNDYSWAVQLTDTLPGLVNNFFSPLRSSVFPFGSSALYLLVICLPLLRLFRIKIPLIVWVIYVSIGFVLLHMMGDYTPVHYLTWRYFPLASNVRSPERISIILPILFMLLLVWLFRERSNCPDNSATSEPISPRALLGMISLTVLTLYLFIPDALNNNLFFLARYNLQLLPQWVEPAILIISFVVLAAVVIHGFSPAKKQCVEFFLCLLVVAYLFVVLKFIPFPFVLKDPAGVPTLEQLRSRKYETMNAAPQSFFLIAEKRSSKVIIEQRKEYILAPHLGKIYRKFKYVESRREAYEFLKQRADQDEVVVEQYCDRSDQASVTPLENRPDQVSLLYSSYNRMVFKTHAFIPSFFVFSYAKTGHWKAWVNNKKETVYRANGYAQAVRIPVGISTVEFRYWSWAAFCGMIISCITLTLIGVWCGLCSSSRPNGIFIAAMAVVVGAGLFFLWYHSLYAGRNLHTHYNWTSEPPSASGNLAYNKDTRMSSIATVSAPAAQDQRLYIGRYAVDGGLSFPSSSLTDLQANPWWEVDLGYPAEIGVITIYISLQGRERNRLVFCHDNFVPEGNRRFVLREQGVMFNQLPLIVSVSADRQRWESIIINSIDKNKPLKLGVANAGKVRYVRIMASGMCRLCLDEVAVSPVF